MRVCCHGRAYTTRKCWRVHPSTCAKCGQGTPLFEKSSGRSLRCGLHVVFTLQYYQAFDTKVAQVRSLTLKAINILTGLEISIPLPIFYISLQVFILSNSTEPDDYAGYPDSAVPLWCKTPDSLSLKSFPPCESIFDLPQIHEDETLRYATIRRSRTLTGFSKRRSVTEQSDPRATWPAFTTKQRLPLPWDSLASPRPATINRSSSARVRRNIVTTSASNTSLNQSSSARKLTGKHYIERKTITVEINRESRSAEWGFTIGGGICSPYGDLPIFIADISATGDAQGLLQNGDEIVDFSGESFEGATFLEAAKMLRRCTKTKATVTIKRKFLQRSQNPQSNPYAEAWSSSVNTTKTTSGCRQRRRPKSMHC